jgi:hypothetical protein
MPRDAGRTLGDAARGLRRARGSSGLALLLTAIGLGALLHFTVAVAACWSPPAARRRSSP